MSVQTGIWFFTGKAVTRHDVEFLLHGLEARGSDCFGIHVRGNLGMGFRGVLITPEDKKNQPVYSNNIAITFDGRLDRRMDLARRVSIFPCSMASDAELVLAAYETYGSR